MRRFVNDLRARGIGGYLILLDPEKPQELKLARLVLRVHGRSWGAKGIMFGGRTDLRELV
jgi:hypothetical protein